MVLKDSQGLKVAQDHVRSDSHYFPLSYFRQTNRISCGIRTSNLRPLAHFALTLKIPSTSAPDSRTCPINLSLLIRPFLVPASLAKSFHRGVASFPWHLLLPFNSFLSHVYLYKFTRVWIASNSKSVKKLERKSKGVIFGSPYGRYQKSNHGHSVLILNRG